MSRQFSATAVLAAAMCQCLSVAFGSSSHYSDASCGTIDCGDYCDGLGEPGMPDAYLEGDAGGDASSDSVGGDMESLQGSAPTTGLAMGQQFGGGSSQFITSSVAYIDSALIRRHFRFRFDAAYAFDEPDRAEYFYSTWDTFGGKTPVATIGPNRSIDAQFLRFYYEHPFTNYFSATIESVVIFNDPNFGPGPGPSTQGFGDMIVGFKYLFADYGDQKLTFQVNNYIPTGEEDKWLTAGHYSIEPAPLYFNRLSSNWVLEGEFRDWISIGGAVNHARNGKPYAGNVLRYGLGLSYFGLGNRDLYVRPVGEVVGWTVLEGQKFAFDPNGPVDAAGDTIVNTKIGLRIGRPCGPGDMYFGYGHAITEEAWYRDIVRAEYRLRF